MTAAGKGRRAGAKRVQGEERGILEKYAFPLYSYPVYILVVILFAVSVEWDANFGKDTITEFEGKLLRSKVNNSWDKGIASYTMYMDVAAMCVVGFGMLYTFSKYYVWGGVGLNFFICGFCFLWVNVCKTIINSIWAGEWIKTQLNMSEMTSGAYITAAVLISFGAVHGLASPSQILFMCFVEPFLVIVNRNTVVDECHVSDPGNSLIVHAFGAFFGIAYACGMGVKAKRIPTEHRNTTYLSDMGAMIGTVVLWVFWPSFNGALFYDDVTLQGRIVMNTYLAICASCVTAFATSPLAHRGKMEMIEIQNATLSGGVIIGMISSFDIDPWVPVLIGGLGGIFSTWCYALYHHPLEVNGVIDSAAVQMLHGIPGILGGIFAAFAVLANNENYLYSYDAQWTTNANMERDQAHQFGYVIVAMVSTLLISTISGFIAGFLSRQPCCPTVKSKNVLLDHEFWDVHDLGSDPRLIIETTRTQPQKQRSEVIINNVYEKEVVVTIDNDVEMDNIATE